MTVSPCLFVAGSWLVRLAGWLLRWVCIAAAIIIFWGNVSKAQELSGFNQLPKEVRNLVAEVRNNCKELEPEKRIVSQSMAMNLA